MEDVLYFFDDAAFCVEKGALDEEMMWHAFYHWVRLFYQASEKYIIDRQKEEPTVWSALGWIYPRLNTLEKARSGNAYKEKLNITELERDLRDIYEGEKTD
jgi:hypothetical protein